MTKIHLILYLTTTLSFALLAAGNGHCTNQHPYAYDNGKRCCKTNWENPKNETECKGRMLNISSSCCDGENVPCQQMPCKNYQGCIKKGCKDMVKMTNDFMDPTEEPCNNFFKYTCGKYVENLKIPDGHVGFSESFGGVANIVFNRFKKILKELPTKSTQFKSDILAYNLHQSCINTKKIERLQFSPLHTILNKYGGFPVVMGPCWNVSDYDVWKHVTTLAANGIDPNHLLLSFNVDIDEKNSTRRVMSLDQVKLPYAVGAYSADEFLDMYYKHMVDSVILLGAKNDTAHRDMKEVLQFETELAKISTSGRTDLNVFYNKRTLGDLEGQPGYPPSIVDYIKTLLNSAKANKVIVNRNDEVIVKNLDYARNLSRVIKSTSNRTIANYLSWKAYCDVAEFLHKDSRMAKFNFISKIEGQEAPWPRWKQCILDLGTLLPAKRPHSLSVLLTSLYARNYFQKEKLKRPNQIVDDVTKSFRYMLERLDWMDPQTKASAIRKLDRMKRRIAYTDDVFKPDVIDRFFNGVNMTGDYIQNHLALKLFWRRKFYENLMIPVGPNDLTRDVPKVMVNAFHVNARNLMQYSAGIFEGLFFDEDLPEMMNLPGIGIITGHEILHGFDDQGRLYDSEGNLKNWWKNSTLQKFKNRTDCIIKQFGSYVHPQVNMTLNGHNTQGENIAETSGLLAAYGAFENAKDPNNPFLADGHYFTADQWFFVRFAHTQCGKDTDAALWHAISFGEHPPRLFRVNGVVSNNYNFAKAFHCPLGSPMNPVKKCRVW